MLCYVCPLLWIQNNLTAFCPEIGSKGSSGSIALKKKGFERIERVKMELQD